MTYTESDLIIPVLTLLAQAGEAGLTTTEIKNTLLDDLELSAEDLQILTGRNDSHFSQQVRNLVSHDTLTKKGLATYEAGPRTGRFRITPSGRNYLEEHSGDFDYISSSGFSEAERKTVIESDYKNLVIEEGHYIPVNQKEKRKRSRKLTELARKHYAREGRLSCAACSFNFDDFYGDKARNYIEIHHLKPIHTYGQDDVERELEQALANVRPLCANCHRMAHRDGKNVLSPTELRTLVQAHGTFDIPSVENDEVSSI